MAIKQTASRRVMVPLRSFTIEGVDLKELMAEKIGPRPKTSGCSYIGGRIQLGSIIDGEVYHCFGATVVVCGNSLSIISEDISKAKEGLDKVLGSPLIPFTRSKYYQP